MSSLKEQYYQSVLLSIHRGNSHGRFVNAKPLYVLSIIKSIETGLMKVNRICYPNTELEGIYLLTCKELEPNIKPSPFILPYFHLSTESFYHIHWKGKAFKPSAHAHSPSQKYLREQLDYAFLDESLWEILQIAEVQKEYKQVVINFFINQ